VLLLRLQCQVLSRVRNHSAQKKRLVPRAFLLPTIAIMLTCSVHQVDRVVLLLTQPLHVKLVRQDASQIDKPIPAHFPGRDPPLTSQAPNVGSRVTCHF